MRAPHSKALRFALGPVQSFFAQSRRTRDLWSSSFLVSYLSACAVDAFIEAGAKIILPDVTEDRLVAAVRDTRLGKYVEDPPEIGSVPNQLTIEADDPAAAARVAVERVTEAWNRITDAVWDKIAPAAKHGREIRIIWERQLGAFWQIYWAIGGADALRRRKAWRGQPRQAEPGDKCTLMAGWQELSGYHRATERQRQDRFWQKLRQGYDLTENERLCALALVKRLFPSVAERAIGWKLDTVHWPSTPYLAARPWVEDILVHGDAGRNGESSVVREAEDYAELIIGLTPPAHQREKGAKRIHAGVASLESPFLDLSGGYFFQRDLALPKRTPLTDEDLRDELSQMLGKIYEKAGKAGRRPKPSAFYALLQLDGDHLGKLFTSSENPSKTSAALARFAREAVNLVRERQGLPVYAGGDDLVAFLPLPTALSTTVALAALYESILQPSADPDFQVTTSAALVYAHYRSPLRAVVAEGHRMLEEDAKDGNGRGSIAVALWKASGVTARWVTTWEQLVPDWLPRTAGPGAAPGPPHQIDVVARRLGDDEVSKSFLYGQREILTRLAGREPWRPGLTVELPEGIAPEALVRAELARARRIRDDDEDPVFLEEAARELTELMQPGRRQDGRSDIQENRLAFDPLLLAHFLDVESPLGGIQGGKHSPGEVK